MDKISKLYIFFFLLPIHVIAEFILVTSLYNETDVNRLNEYITCLETNLNHPDISLVHVFYDTTKDGNENALLNYLKNKNVKISYIKNRPSFNLIFSACNRLYPEKKIIVSNADIYFDQTLSTLLSYDLENKFLSLTRWEDAGGGNLIPAYWFLEQTAQPYGSDTWIFTTPIKTIDKIELGLGTWGCDGGIIYQAFKSGLTVLNPCKDIRCCHLHQSQIRHYSTNYPTYPMAYVHAGELSDTVSQIQIIQE